MHHPKEALEKDYSCFWTTLNVPLNIVQTPTQDTEPSEEQHGQAIPHDAGKPTTSLATAVIPTPKQDYEQSNNEPRDKIRHDSGKSTPGVETITRDSQILRR
jgi:hypothetical protein